MTRGRNPFIDLPPFDPDSKFLNSIIDTPKSRTLHAIRRTRSALGDFLHSLIQYSGRSSWFYESRYLITPT